MVYYFIIRQAFLASSVSIGIHLKFAVSILYRKMIFLFLMKHILQLVLQQILMYLFILTKCLKTSFLGMGFTVSIFSFVIVFFNKILTKVLLFSFIFADFSRITLKCIFQNLFLFVNKKILSFFFQILDISFLTFRT